MSDTSHYPDMALDSLALVKLAQTEYDPDHLVDGVEAILESYDEDGLHDLVWMLASLTSTLADQWRASLLDVLPTDQHDSVPSAAALIQRMTDHLLTQELEDA